MSRSPETCCCFGLPHSPKRLFSIVASLLIATASLLTIALPTFNVVMGGQVAMGLAAARFAPVMAATTLGLVGHQALDGLIGRNETFNHAGNVVAAVLAGLIRYFGSSEGIFVLLAVMSLISSVGVWRIREEDIDHDLARGSGEKNAKQSDLKPSDWQALLTNRAILFFALACVLFHFANAAMLSLLGQRLVKATPQYMSACIIVAQVVMVPVSNWIGRLAPRGRKWLLLIAFAVLPIRGLLYTLTNALTILIAIQVLDGIGASIFGVLSILVVADLTQRSGLFNTIQGAIATAVGLVESLTSTTHNKSAGQN